MRIGTSIPEDEREIYLSSGLRIFKFSSNGLTGIFLRLKMKCSACDHLQAHESRGYILSKSVRPFKKAIQEIQNEIFLGTGNPGDGPRKDGQIDCERCGQISLIIPRSQRQHVSEWLNVNATPAWLEAAGTYEPPAQIMGVCVN